MMISQHFPKLQRGEVVDGNLGIESEHVTYAELVSNNPRFGQVCWTHSLLETPPFRAALYLPLAIALEVGAPAPLSILLAMSNT